MNLRDRLIFLSAESRKLNIAENLKRGEELRKLLSVQGCRFSDTKNYYKGVYENGFVIKPVNEEQAKSLRDMVFKLYEQDSVLERDADGLAHLVDKNGSYKTLGKLKKVNDVKDLERYIEINGSIYTTE